MAQAGSRAVGASTPAGVPTQENPPPVAPAAGERVAELEAENARLKAENARLREQVATGQVAPARVTEPSFTFSEGQRAELEATGRTVSPFTGERFVGTGPDDARKASAAEFAAAKPAPVVPVARPARKR